MFVDHFFFFLDKFSLSRISLSMNAIPISLSIDVKNNSSLYLWSKIFISLKIGKEKSSLQLVELEGSQNSFFKFRKEFKIFYFEL